MPHIRDFDPGIIENYSSSRLQVDWRSTLFFENRAWKFTILLPRWFLGDGGKEIVCTAHDENLLRRLLEKDFSGCTVGPAYLHGVGRRGATSEANLHRQIVVLTSHWRGTMQYFRALRKELEACSGEERILILREEPVIV